MQVITIIGGDIISGVQTILQNLSDTCSFWEALKNVSKDLFFKLPERRKLQWNLKKLVKLLLNNDRYYLSVFISKFKFQNMIYPSNNKWLISFVLLTILPSSTYQLLFHYQQKFTCDTLMFFLTHKNFEVESENLIKFCFQW